MLPFEDCYLDELLGALVGCGYSLESRTSFLIYIRYVEAMIVCQCILQIAEQSVLAVGPGQGGLGMPYELMYGRAGFLWAALFVNKYVGEETIPSSVTVSLIHLKLTLTFLSAWPSRH